MNDLKKTKCAIAGQDQNIFSFGYDEEDCHCISLKMKLLQQTSILYESGIRLFITDCSLGVSMWSAEIVAGLMSLHTDIALVCVIPYEKQAIKWPKQYRDRYFSLHNKCTQSILLSKVYTTSCLIECYRYLVDTCDVLLAVCDHNDSGFGKIGFMESYAKNVGRSVQYLNPITLAVTPTILEF